ncbi:hypothetical protein CES85_1681 [Ochrobactrum quorumnocens]|uniref:Uncharacterized protein n=1 Tax=Ochrobactrum quorumnocens TaxID=271865 RepID=A0A248UGT4_9HYPH|nr:hypothetical protein [[Ochrobactrum] quorumnocens]ASV86033.1 hypothetical protein CES85_1681 [[Ochrobactrum] quorumnocens]
MKFSYAFTLMAGGFLTSGYHTMNNPQVATMFFLGGIGSLVIASWSSGEGA